MDNNFKKMGYQHANKHEISRLGANFDDAIRQEIVE